MRWNKISLNEFISNFSETLNYFHTFEGQFNWPFGNQKFEEKHEKSRTS